LYSKNMHASIHVGVLQMPYIMEPSPSENGMGLFPDDENDPGIVTMWLEHAGESATRQLKEADLSDREQMRQELSKKDAIIAEQQAIINTLMQTQTVEAMFDASQLMVQASGAEVTVCTAKSI